MSLIERQASKFRGKGAKRQAARHSPWKVASRHAIALEPRLVFDGSLPATLAENTPVTLHTHTGGGSNTGTTPITLSADQNGDVVLGVATLTNGDRVVLWGAESYGKFRYSGGPYNSNHAGYDYYAGVTNIQLSIIDTSGNVTTSSVSFSGANDPTNKGNGVNIVLTSMPDGGFVIAEDVINGFQGQYEANGGTGNGNAYYQVYDNSGAITKSWTQLNLTNGDTATPAYGNGYVYLAPDASTGGFVAAWVEKNQFLYFERFSDTGTSEAAAIEVGQTGGGGSVSYFGTAYVDGQGDVLLPWTNADGSVYSPEGFTIYSSTDAVIANTTLNSADSAFVGSTSHVSNQGGTGDGIATLGAEMSFTGLSNGFAVVFNLPTSGTWQGSNIESSDYFQEINISGSSVTYGTPTLLATNQSSFDASGVLLTDGNILYQVFQGSSTTPAYWELAPSSPGTHTTPISVTNPSGGSIASTDNPAFFAVSPIAGGGIFAAIQKSSSGLNEYGTPLDASLYVADFGGSVSPPPAADTAPSFTGGGNTTSFTEGGSAITLNSGLSVSDAELNTAGNYAGAILTVERHSAASSSDVFGESGTVALSGGSVTVSGTAVGSYTNSGGELQITFSSAATQALVNTVLDNITYSDTSSGPPASVEIDWSLNDGNTGSQGTGGAMTGTATTTVNTVVPRPSTPDLTAASDSGVSNTDNITNVTTPDFIGSGVTGDTVKLFSDGVQVGSAVVSGGTWNITSSTLGAGTHAITATQTDTNSNVSSASSALDVTIDLTIPATPAVSGLTTATDTGSSHTDGITSDTTPTITGTGTTGDVVTVKDGSTVIGTATVSGGAWSLDLTGHPLSNGTHSITAFQTEVAGNNSAASTAFTLDIDTIPPATPAAPTLLGPTDSGVKGDGITDVKSPIYAGTTEANATVSVYSNGALLGTTTADGTGAWTYTQPSPLGDGDYAITVTAKDAAGNVSTASPALSLVIDTTAPAAPSTPALLGATDSGVKGDGITDVNKPIFTGTAEANATVYLYANGGLLGTTTASGTGAWTFAQPTPIGDGTFSITAAAKDAAGNLGVASSAFTLTIDTVAPAAPSTPALLGPTDSGVKGDGITDINKPIFTGTAEPNATVYVYANGGLLGSTTASGTGAWTFAQPTPIGDGTFSITAAAKDAAGNLGVASSAFTLTIDTVAPAAPSTPALLGPTDSGVKGDGITDINKPIFTGTAEANATVYVYANGGLLGTTTASGTGAWTFTQPTPIGDGTFSITATDKDAAGNTSVASSAFSLTIDTVAPAAPSTPALLPATDSGVKGDGITDITTPVFTGTAEANATVYVYSNGVLLGTTTADGTGAWSFVESTPLADGIYAITAKAKDVAGNIGVASSAFELTIAA